MNILILSCGSRNKIVEYFKNELKTKGKVFATDCDVLAPALYEADQYFIVPRIDEDGYIDSVFSICKENDIQAVFSLIDPELNLLANYANEFENIGTIPIVSSSKVVDICYNKYKMFEFLKNNEFNTIQTYINKEQFYSDVELGLISYPVFIKPIHGSASININKVGSKEEVELLFSKYNNLIIQEYIQGVEYGADVYIDLISGEPVSMFTKKKIKMKSGETDKSVSVKDKKLFELIRYFVKLAGLRGVIDVDIFEVNGEYYISEVNPRFGGGYPHAYGSGVNFPKMLINNLQGNVNKIEIGDYNEGIYMMKYGEVYISKI
ncbi:ATP-grasp domain-containing protein [Lysinibacillus sp. BW-2-10]|uniref:ATP-grasp domain-containing protein n=1 Tax=Lysinibacillus sp. BW-2-10 TaxID=2590030 RepID=UPI00117DEF0E|nr:ATP-grasp domain-containing protein [Lysinibacillus sp. BW-2-10]TSI11332.1 ATP-grasp domain-containing protein [Lysinibacillus sp. BW-2-10]